MVTQKVIASTSGGLKRRWLLQLRGVGGLLPRHANQLLIVELANAVPRIEKGLEELRAFCERRLNCNSIALHVPATCKRCQLQAILDRMEGQ